MTDAEFLTLVTHYWKPDCIGFKVNSLSGGIDLVRISGYQVSVTGITGSGISDCIVQLKDLFAKNHLENSIGQKPVQDEK